MLRPGGLLISCEWGQDVTFHPDWANNGDPALHVPNAQVFFNAVAQAFQSVRNIPPIASRIPSLLESSPLFENVTPRVFYMPIGPWPDGMQDMNGQEMGRAYRASLRRYADSVKHLLYEAGWSRNNVEVLVQAFKEELTRVGGHVGGLVSSVYTVHARRVQGVDVV